MTRRQLTLFLLTISIMDALIIGALVGATSGPLLGASLGIGSAISIWIIVIAIGWMISRVGAWSKLAQRYPAIDGIDFDRGARVISLGLGSPWMRVNNCIEAIADESHLHLRIGLPGAGAGRPVSIPWEAVTSVEPASMGQAKLDVEGVRLWLPRRVIAGELELRAALERAETGETGMSPGAIE